MDRMSVFLPADNDAGHVQAVIIAKEYPFFEKLGFVKSVDDIKPVKSKRQSKAAENGDDSDKG
jgi:hypothetical protein